MIHFPNSKIQINSLVTHNYLLVTTYITRNKMKTLKKILIRLFYIAIFFLSISIRAEKKDTSKTDNQLKNSSITTQSGISNSIPNDFTGMTSSAKKLISKIALGWNLGNTLEVPGNETGWGNALTKQTLIDSVKAAGFNAVRLPCAWNSHLSDTAHYVINPTWLARIKQVIDYCYKNDMYVVLNIHWDGGWLENNCTKAKQEVNNRKQRILWNQIAVYFRNYDEHLLFAGSNEPNVDNETEMSVLLSYEQTFIDAVRATGGRNYYRTLIVQGPSTDIDKTAKYMTNMPVDVTINRLALEVHYYSPFQFCLLDKDANWGKMAYFWGAKYHQPVVNGVDRNSTFGEEAYVNERFAKIKTLFVDKGYPVIMGEFGVTRRLSLTGSDLVNHLASRAYYLQYVVQQAKNYGLAPFYWDAGHTGDNGTGLFNRNTGAIEDKQAINALVDGAKKGVYPY
jgi:endoglucanase